MDPIVIKNTIVSNIDVGSGNRIIGKLNLDNSYIRFYGKGNIIYVGDGYEKEVKISKSGIHFEGDNSIVVLLGRRSGSFKMRLGFSSNILIGEAARFGVCEFYAESYSSILIGNNFLSAFETKIWNSDAHLIFDNASKNIINKGKSIFIGDHCWLSFGSMVLKGAKISSGCVIGAKSLITRGEVIRSNSLVVGAPAKVLKENISWNEYSPLREVVDSSLFDEKFVYKEDNSSLSYEEIENTLNDLSGSISERMSYIRSIFINNQSKNRFASK